MTWYYISFARPAGFAGGIVVEGQTALAAIEKALELGAPTDAEAMALELPIANLPSERWRNRVLTKEMIDLVWGGGVSLKDAEESGLYDMEELAASATYVCGDCLAGKCTEHGRKQ